MTQERELQQRPENQSIARKRRELKILGRLAAEGRLSPDILERREATLRALVELEPTSVRAWELRAKYRGEEARFHDLCVKFNEKFGELHRLDKDALDVIAGRTAQNPISHSEWARFVYCDERIPIEVVKKRFGNFLPRFKRRIEQIGFKVVDLVPQIDRTKGREGQYYLTPITEEPKKAEEPEKIEAERPKLIFFEDLNQIEVDERAITLTGKQAKVLQVLARNLDQKIPSRQLSQEALGKSSPSKAQLRDFISAIPGSEKSWR